MQNRKGTKKPSNPRLRTTGHLYGHPQHPAVTSNVNCIFKVLLSCDNWISETIHVETIGKRTVTEKKVFVTHW